MLLPHVKPALRLFRRRPGVALILVGTLGLGLGTAAADAMEALKAE